MQKGRYVLPGTGTAAGKARGRSLPEQARSRPEEARAAPPGTGEAAGKARGAAPGAQTPMRRRRAKGKNPMRKNRKNKQVVL